MECDVFFSMEVKAAISWKCYVFNSMEFHGIAGLTFGKCTPADSMEKFQTTVGLTLGDQGLFFCLKYLKFQEQ